MIIINKLFLILLISTHVAVFSQGAVPLFKLSMNSDIIVESSDFSSIEKPYTEYYSENTIAFKSINHILKNHYNDKIINQSYKLNTKGEDYYDLNEGGCIANAYNLDPHTKYYNIYFIKKIEKTYYIIGQLRDVTQNCFLFISENIKKLNEIEKIKNDNKKYVKTVDWYIELMNNDCQYKIENIFTVGFINYYKSKGVIKEEIILQENQKIKAKESFLQGNENLYELIKKDFPEETDQYYLSQLYKIKNIADKSYSDYYDFQSKANIFLEQKEDLKIKFINETLTSDLADYTKNDAIDLILEFIETNIKKK
ncbi:hypothetical protein [Flavobacterium chungangense]|uniref:hypothetical protein n=1 Tax=Flavobacterium chungangense TaxID=554283 RepID=UPI000AC55166|nr:hypothetical protein [Flavobacterium chungangense]